MIASRTVNSVRNTVFSAIAYIAKMLLQFVVRYVFIRFFVAEYLGVNGLFTNILNVLSLAELGIGDAIVYSMYKPIAENDTEKIKSLVRLYRNIYLIIAAVVITVGLAIIPALPYLINDTASVDIDLLAVYLLYLAQTVVGYFFAYRRSLVFANQRNDIESKVSLVVQIILAISQVVIIVFWKNFYAYTAAFVVCNALDSIIVFSISYKLFPEIKGKTKKLEKSDTKKIAKNTGALVFHKLGGAVVVSSDSIIISAFLGSSILGYYSNYTLVIAASSSVINLVVTAFKGSIGNFIAQKSVEEVYKTYKALNLAIMWMIGFMTIGLITCFQHFIIIYTGKTEYMLEISTVFLLCISFYLTSSRSLTIAFKDCAGLFWNDRFKPLFEAGINLGLDFLFVRHLGINGVILATIISTIIVPLWIEPHVLYKKYFGQNTCHFFANYFAYAFVTFLICCVTYGICFFLPAKGVWWFLLRFVFCLIIPNFLFFVIYAWTPEFKFLASAVHGLLKSIKK